MHRERVQVHGFGVFIIGVYPGAFVDLNSDQLAALSPARQLRVYCAGVWHNFVLSLACVALLAAMPALVWPLYTPTAAGATVQYITPVRVCGAAGLGLHRHTRSAPDVSLPAVHVHRARR